MKKKKILDVHDKRYSILENRKCARQRARKGYCERDIYSINAWFLDIIPEMLKDLSKTRKNYPSNLLAEFYEKDKDQIIGTKEEFVFGPHNKNKDVFEEAVAWSEKDGMRFSIEWHFFFQNAEIWKTMMNKETNISRKDSNCS